MRKFPITKLMLAEAVLFSAVVALVGSAIFCLRKRVWCV